MGWVLAVDQGCDQEHNIENCHANHPRYYRDTDAKSHLAGPQILAYSVVTNSDEINEITVINDSGSKDVNVIWDTNDDGASRPVKDVKNFPIYLNKNYFPVRTTAELLSDLAGVLPWGKSAKLTDEQRASLRAVLEAMWARAGSPEISPAAALWIRQEVRDCTGGPGHVLEDEDEPLEHDFKSWEEYVGSSK
jgi:hypothetical protein